MRKFSSQRRQRCSVCIPALVETMESRELLSSVTVQLSAGQDTTIYNVATGDLSNGAGEYLVVGGAEGFAASRRGLLSFDVASAGIPDGATILDAVLTLNLAESVGAATTVSLHSVSKAWGESTSDASGNEFEGVPAGVRDATWLFSLFDSTAWVSAGGDFRAESASLTVDGLGAWQWYGAGVVSDVQSWLDNPASNFGWMLKSSETSGTIKGFVSRDGANAALRPTLEITYEEPVIPGIVEGRKWFDRNADGLRLAPAVQALRLNFPGGKANLNAFGGQEYWYRSAANNSWYFLTPTGELRQWSGQRGKLTGAFVDSFGARAWYNPEIFMSAGANQDEPWLNGFVFDLVDSADTVVATTESRDIDLNGDGQIQEEQERGWYRFNNVRPGKYTVRERVPTGWAQSASVTSPGAVRAWTLDQTLGLTFSGNLHQNFGGQGERWLKGTAGWYYITPSGELFRWNGRTVTSSAPLSGVSVAALGMTYFSDVSLLYAAENPVLSVSEGALVTRVNFGNYRPSVISGRTWTEVDTNGVRNIAGMPTAVATTVPENVPPALKKVTWYELTVPDDPNTGTGGTSPSTKRLYYTTQFGEVYQWSATAGSSLVTRISAAAGLTAAAIARAAFVTEPWQNGVTIELLNEAGFVVARSVSGDSDLNSDQQIDAETERGWYRFSGLIPGKYTIRQTVTVGNRAVSEASPPLEKTAAQLSADYGFKADTTDHFNFGGRNERWFKSRSGDWYYITPNGVVSKWDRNSGGSLGLVRGSQIARLSGNYYVNLNLLFQPVKTELVTQGGETITMNFAQATLLDTVFASIASSIT
jgi:hypothetical protein